MRFHFADYEIRLQRRRPRPGAFDDCSADELQKQALCTILATSPAEHRNRLETLIIANSPPAHVYSDLTDRLAHDGIAVIPDFLTEEVLSSAEAIARKINSYLAQTPGDFTERSELIIQRNSARFTSYRDLESHPKPIASVRPPPDDGMIDVFNIDRLASEPAKLREPFSQKWLLRAVSENNVACAPRNLNLYINNSVATTRGFHADTYSRKIKAFVYLTDVNELEHGPYTYVVGSHKDGPWRLANQTLSRQCVKQTEAPVVDTSKIVPVLGAKGTLVVSDQAGFHRGLPQAHGKERQVLVMSYH